MSPELQQFIERTKFHQPVVRQVIELLPTEDAALDSLLAEVVAANDQKAFMYVTLGAAAADRRMDARHLARGAMLFPFHDWLGVVAVRMQGEVSEHLLAAIQTTRLSAQCEAAALLLIADWCREHRGGTFPDKLIPLARELARRASKDPIAFGFLLGLAMQTQDAGLKAVLHQQYPGTPEMNWQSVEVEAVQLVEKTLARYRKPAMESVRMEANAALGDGAPLRRAVARRGRNEPCPCGSGKKYKHCCYEKDQERLSHSSEVAGLTVEELDAKLDEHLTAARLDQTDPYQVARLNPVTPPPRTARRIFRTARRLQSVRQGDGGTGNTRLVRRP